MKARRRATKVRLDPPGRLLISMGDHMARHAKPDEATG